MKNKMRLLIMIMAVLLAFALLCGCGTKTADPNSVYQISTLQALVEGGYTGAVTAKELTQYGDTGLGTFDALDGEMIVLNGTVYKAAFDGTVSVAPDDETIPFANVANLTASDTVTADFNGGYDALKNVLTRLFPEENKPVMFCIQGNFENITYRSVPEQQQPYPPLTEVVAQQAVFEKGSADGTLVGFRFPSYMGDINANGYHLHFISDDKTFGGHLLEVSAGQIDVMGQPLDRVTMDVPDTIADMDLSGTTEDDISTVESTD